MTAPTWTYLVADLRTNVIIGELPLTAPQITKMVNASGTLNGTTLPLADPRMRALNVYDMTMPARRAIYAVRDGRPWWGGIIWTRSYKASAGTVSIGCADFWSYFDHRKVIINSGSVIPPSSPTAIAASSMTFNGFEQNQLASGLIVNAQTWTGGDIGVVWDNAVSGITRTRTYYGYEMGDVGARLRELAGLIDGPDILFEPGPFDAQGRPQRLMRTGTPRLGQQGTPHVWEFGGNLVDYEWPSDGTRMATRTYAVGDGIDQSALIAESEDATKYTNGWPVLEADTSYTTVSDYNTLQSHADADRTAARLPVVLAKLVVRGDRVPRLGDVGIGDDCQVLIKDLFFRAGMQTTMRVLGIDVTPSESVELVTLTTAPTIEDFS